MNFNGDKLSEATCLESLRNQCVCKCKEFHVICGLLLSGISRCLKGTFKKLSKTCLSNAQVFIYNPWWWILHKKMKRKGGKKSFSTENNKVWYKHTLNCLCFCSLVCRAIMHCGIWLVSSCLINLPAFLSISWGSKAPNLSTVIWKTWYSFSISFAFSIDWLGICGASWPAPHIY